MRVQVPPPADQSEIGQAPLVKALEQGQVRGAEEILRRVDTHLSRVFIGAGRAYKLKRAVRLPFIDMRALSTRERLCRREAQLNHAAAPDLYLGIAAITQSADGALALNGDGQTLDWLVVMRPFPPDATFDALAERNALTLDLVNQAVDAAAAFHAAAEPSAHLGHAADFRAILAQLQATELHGAARLGAHAASDDLFAKLNAEWTRRQIEIEQRFHAGKARRCHGDLHLGNLCLFQGRAMLFDALEFDERLATIDVLYDFAFLLMDLWARGLHAFANSALNRYFDAAGEDEAALGLAPFYMAVRAAVRMAVAIEAGDLAKAAAYRALAHALLAPRHGAIVAIGGLSGTGKSSLARALAPCLGGAPGARVLRTDVIRKTGPAAQLSAPGLYSKEARAQVYRQMLHRAARGAHAGATLILDATFNDDDARAALAQVFPNCVALWLRAPASVRLSRIGARRNDASDADAAIAAAQTEPQALAPHWIVLDASLDTPDLVKQALAQVRAAAISRSDNA